ncbi:MAG: hypothetical protein ICV68_04725 [Pyrinomonadaceae bacterium]|nr:hypothetical protein [Pyrinomonadaceae bacterium]
MRQGTLDKTLDDGFADKMCAAENASSLIVSIDLELQLSRTLKLSGFGLQLC